MRDTERDSRHAQLVGYVSGAFEHRKSANSRATASTLADMAAEALGVAITPEDMARALREAGYQPSSYRTTDGTALYPVSIKRGRTDGGGQS